MINVSCFTICTVADQDKVCKRQKDFIAIHFIDASQNNTGFLNRSVFKQLLQFFIELFTT